MNSWKNNFTENVTMMDMDFFKELLKPLEERARSLGKYEVEFHGEYRDEYDLDHRYGLVVVSMIHPRFSSPIFQVSYWTKGEEGVLTYWISSGDEQINAEVHLSNPKCVEKLIEVLETRIEEDIKWYASICGNE